ncbi:hypothetical protein L1049_023271 [Liquidambar formosana]|uniref:J domain-containing protein n=1 Tax=Liquidambar formosana TaxID=63359 RepID=A0AAP0RZ24_LIQFO
MLSTYFPSVLHSSPPFTGKKISGKPSSPAPASVKFRSRPVVTAAYASAERTRSSYLGPNKMASCLSLYEILGISMGANNQEIKAAYRRLARTSHPDVAAIDRKDSSADAFMKIHAAYSTLSDPEKRADYDRKLFRRHRPFESFSGISSPVTAMSGFSGYTRRNWETDQCW